LKRISKDGRTRVLKKNCSKKKKRYCAKNTSARTTVG